MINFKSIKTQLNLFLAAFAIFLYLKDPRSSFLASLFLGIFFCAAIEAVILYFKTKKIQITASALTSGFILGYVLSSDSPWWVFLAAAFLTVGLKRVIKFHGKNLLNPAACGIFFTVLLFNAYTEWNGAYVWYILAPAGLYIVYKIKKWELLLGYFLTSCILFVPQTLKQGAPLSIIPGYFNYFFIFIMLIEPKTTPAARWPKVIFGAGVALFIFALTELGFRYEPELFALLVFNAVVPFLSKISNLKFETKKQLP